MRIELHGQNRVFVEGQPYVPGKELAQLCRLGPDYLSRLARSGRIDAVRIAGSWYLSIASLARFRSTLTRTATVEETAPASLTEATSSNP